jgi:hypothetical protein
VQTFSMSVDAQANMWGAGHTAAPGGGLLPPGVTLELGGGAIVLFTSVTGTVTHNGATVLPPDGATAGHVLPNSSGISGYSHATRTRALSAVFLGPDEPVNPAPASLVFANAEFTTLSPGLHQMFFIGDGRTSGNVLQRFVVPAGATRLFVGNTDVCTGNVPGCFLDNTGSFSVTGHVQLP